MPTISRRKTALDNAIFANCVARMYDRGARPIAELLTELDAQFPGLQDAFVRLAEPYLKIPPSVYLDLGADRLKPPPPYPVGD